MYFFANITNGIIEKKKNGFFLDIQSIVVEFTFLSLFCVILGSIDL